jgi:hypothetical protein
MSFGYDFEGVRDGYFRATNPKKRLADLLRVEQNKMNRLVLLGTGTDEVAELQRKVESLEVELKAAKERENEAKSMATAASEEAAKKAEEQVKAAQETAATAAKAAQETAEGQVKAAQAAQQMTQEQNKLLEEKIAALVSRAQKAESDLKKMNEIAGQVADDMANTTARVKRGSEEKAFFEVLPDDSLESQTGSDSDFGSVGSEEKAFFEVSEHLKSLPDDSLESQTGSDSDVGSVFSTESRFTSGIAPEDKDFDDVMSQPHVVMSQPHVSLESQTGSDEFFDVSDSLTESAYKRRRPRRGRSSIVPTTSRDAQVPLRLDNLGKQTYSPRFGLQSWTPDNPRLARNPRK